MEEFRVGETEKILIRICFEKKIFSEVYPFQLVDAFIASIINAFKIMNRHK